MELTVEDSVANCKFLIKSNLLSNSYFGEASFLKAVKGFIRII